MMGAVEGEGSKQRGGPTSGMAQIMGSTEGEGLQRGASGWGREGGVAWGKAAQEWSGQPRWAGCRVGHFKGRPR